MFFGLKTGIRLGRGYFKIISIMTNIRRFVTNRLIDVAALMTRIYVKKSKITCAINRSDQRKQKIIASITSYPDRFDVLPTTVKSIMLQSLKPDKIILWLGNDTNQSDLPMQLLDLENMGLEIRFVDENLMPHKKYLYAMREYKDDIIITFDDDVVYSPFTISSLIRCHYKNPNCVCARRVHKILIRDGKILPYSEWEFNCTSIRQPSFQLFATGIGAVLYPPRCIDERGLDSNSIKNECLKADDVWLKVMETLANTKVVWAKNFLIVPPDVKANQLIGLAADNVNGNQNDMYINNLEKNYHFETIIKENCFEGKKK